jgi:hypothetical protein
MGLHLFVFSVLSLAKPLFQGLFERYAGGNYRQPIRDALRLDPRARDHGSGTLLTKFSASSVLPLPLYFATRG